MSAPAPSIKFIGQNVDRIDVLLKDFYGFIKVNTKPDNTLVLKYVKTLDTFADTSDIDPTLKIIPNWQVDNPDHYIAVGFSIEGVSFTWYNSKPLITENQAINSLFIPMTRVFHIFVTGYKP